MDLLEAGASKRGGHSKLQMELLGLTWPLQKGWRTEILGREVSKENAEEFVRLADRPAVAGRSISSESHWGGSLEPVQIHLYVHALQDDCFYVGLTKDVETRTKQHQLGDGAKWTKLHPPIRLLHAVNTGTTSTPVALKLEDEMTIALMERYGIERVRGGRYTVLQQELVERTLKSHNVWDRVNQAELRSKGFDTQTSWGDAVDDFLAKALGYYDSDAPKDQVPDVFSACYRLTRYRQWREDYMPGLSWEFWNAKGILPVLLSFRLARPVASGVSTPFEVLAAALTRGKNGTHPLRRLFLLAWRAFRAPTTDNQSKTIARFMNYLENACAYDDQYDSFVSMLFPETRHLLRSCRN